MYTLRLIPGVAVTGADTLKRDGGGDVPIDIKGLYRRPKKICSDGGYSGGGFAIPARRLGREVEIIKRSDDREGFKVLPKRRIAECMFNWPGRYRRLSKAYESRVESRIAMIQIAMTKLTLHRLQPG